MQARASYFYFQQPLFSLRSSSSCLRLLPRLPVTSILPSIFLSITCCRRQFLRNMWLIQLLCFIVCGKFLSSLTLCKIHFSNNRCQMILSILLQHHISKSVYLKLEELRFVVNCLANACYKCSIHRRVECHLAAPGDTSIYGQEIRKSWTCSHRQPPTWSVTPAWELEE